MRDDRGHHKRQRSLEDHSGRPAHGYGRPREDKQRPLHGANDDGRYGDRAHDHRRPREDDRRSRHDASDDGRYGDGGLKASRDERSHKDDGSRARRDEAPNRQANGGANGAHKPDAKAAVPDGYGLRFGSHMPEGMDTQDR